MNDISLNHIVKIIIKMLLIMVVFLVAIYIIYGINFSTCGCPEDIERRAINAAASELNGRESLMWTEQKQSDTYKNDAELFKEMLAKKNYSLNMNYQENFLNENYEWMSNSGDPPIPVGQPKISGGSLSFQRKIILRIDRTASDRERPALWKVAE